MGAVERITCLLVLFLVSTSVPAAKIHKCKDSNGRVTYTSQGCPANNQAADTGISTGSAIKSKSRNVRGASYASSSNKQSEKIQNYVENSKQACMNDIDEYVAKMESGFTKFVNKRYEGVIRRELKRYKTEITHMVGFNYLADGSEKTLSGECRATLKNNVWVAHYDRVNMGLQAKPFGDLPLPQD